MILRKGVMTIVQVGILYGLYRFGTFLQQQFDLFIPGSIIGMLILFFALMLNQRFTRFIDKGSGFFLKYLPLFFIPASVGVMNYFQLFQGKAIWIVIITMISTLIVLLASSLTSRFFKKEKRGLKG